MSDNTKTICRFAWDYPNITVSRNEVRLCCRAATNSVHQEDIDRHGVKLFSQFEPLVFVKKELLMGRRAPACDSCWRVEDTGAKSARSGLPYFVEMLRDVNWFGTQDVEEIARRVRNITEEEADQLATMLDKPRMIEVALSNTCDLKCVYCSHHYSSQWATERRKYGDIPIKDLAKELPEPNENFRELFWQYFDTVAFKNAEIINFIGGEPLIIDEFYEYLDRILTKYETWPDQSELPPAVFIGIVTNLNCQPKYFQKLLDVLPRIISNPRFHLDFNVSMESVGARAEYIRTGTKWDRLDKNVRDILQFFSGRSPAEKHRIHFGFQVALNALCISDLPNFVKYVIDRRSEIDLPIRLRPNQVVYPIWLAPSVLPPPYMMYVEAAIRLLQLNAKDEAVFHKFDSWTSYITFLRTIQVGIKNPHKDDGARHMFVREVTKLYDRRGIEFLSTFPEMVPFYNQMKKDLGYA